VIASPLRFQMGMAVVAIGGALAVTNAHEPRPDPDPAFTFQDPTIDESSGLIDLGDRVLTVNDSGDGPVIYVVDRSTGKTVGRTTYTSDEVVDVEAMAPGVDGTVWVGDIGDNGGSRSSVAVYTLPAPTPGDRSVVARRYDLVYEGGPRDAEALLVQPRTGRLFVVSKGLFGGTVYAAPRTLSAEHANVLRPVADVGGLVTDAAYFPGGRFVALRSYSTLTVLEGRRWRSVQGMALPDQNQGEGLAMTASGKDVLVSTEGAGSDVLAVALTQEVLERVAPPSPSPSPSPSPDTAAVGRPLEADEATHSSDDRSAWEVAALAAVTLAAALGVRAWFRRRQRRSTT
jgi:hypothetical protein